MTPGQAALLAAAGLAAGAVNAVAGGGSLISFPALLAVGLPAVPANVTNAVALWPGYLGGALGYFSALRSRARELLPLVVASLAGAVLGSVALLLGDPETFRVLVPYLILLSCLLLAVQPRVQRLVRQRSAADGSGRRRGVLVALVGLGSVYGAYFGAGLGVMLLAVLGMLMNDTLAELNGVKNALSLFINTVALLAFALFGPVQWPAVLIMAVASLAGGYAGALVARRVPSAVLRVGVVVLGVVVAVVLLVRG